VRPRSIFRGPTQHNIVCAAARLQRHARIVPIHGVLSSRTTKTFPNKARQTTLLKKNKSHSRVQTQSPRSLV
jgi:hypothetical protein